MLWTVQDTPKLLNIKYHLYMTLAKLKKNVAIISIRKRGNINHDSYNRIFSSLYNRIFKTIINSYNFYYYNNLIVITRRRGDFNPRCLCRKY